MKFPAREVLDLGRSFPEVRSLKSWGHPHLAPQSNQAGLLQNRDKDDPLTLGADVEIRSETDRTNDRVGEDSQRNVFWGRFWGFPGLFVERTHLRAGGKKETKAMDPQNQTSPLRLSAAGTVTWTHIDHSLMRCGRANLRINDIGNGPRIEEGKDRIRTRRYLTRVFKSRSGSPIRMKRPWDVPLSFWGLVKREFRR